ncbi:hypothetical protein ACDP63_08860 [Paracoccus sp. P2]|uniref:hypothetical protein n=1 Tax=Paracoccus sp. P2 TaxID=3248840 RepID=UPI00391F7E91
MLRRAEKAEAARDANAKWLGELLAVIHRDGGHYQSQHGDEKAVDEAHMIVARLLTERDEARAQVAMAYEAAAKTCSLAATNYLGKGADTDLGSRSRAICDVACRIRALIPADAKAALEAYGREKVREGMQRAADLFKDANHGEHIMSAILAAIEKEGGE